MDEGTETVKTDRIKKWADEHPQTKYIILVLLLVCFGITAALALYYMNSYQTNPCDACFRANPDLMCVRSIVK